MDLEQDNAYNIPVTVTLSDGTKSYYVFSVILDGEKWLIFKISGGKND